MSELPNRGERLDETLNWVSDQDVQWWPFLFLRPAQDERMSALRVATVSVLLGFFAGMIANLAVAYTSVNAVERLALFALPPWLTLPLGTSALFFVFFSTTFAASWNRRARRLAPSRIPRTRR
jgi:hypothetical protein